MVNEQARQLVQFYGMIYHANDHLLSKLKSVQFSISSSLFCMILKKLTINKLTHIKGGYSYKVQMIDKIMTRYKNTNKM